MDHIPRLSEAVYVGLCREVGSPTEVRFRREVTDTGEAVENSLKIRSGYYGMMSGSTREGFRLITSDMDRMLWPAYHKVICDLSQISLYRIPQHTVILMECDDLPPGFTRLNLMSPSKNGNIRSSCVFMNNEVYISSVLFRANHLRYIKSRFTFADSSFQHGPCSTFINGNNEETDLAFCFFSYHWPSIGLPWVQRCRQQGWPSEIVLSDIISGGFHVVPIGSTPENGEEWRISFSKAEQKLVYSMNHCQFLCYGLFKFFLNDVINFQNDTPILCSYFIKTCLFWLVQNNNSLIWTPSNLLSCFWEGFKLLIYWVHIGECPNFFIPQNNMFRIKVTGSVQAFTFSRLYDLYRKGTPCLLLCKTLRPYLSKAILNKTLRVCTDESSIISNAKLDVNFFQELHLYRCAHIDRIDHFRLYMKTIKQLIIGNLTPYQIVTLQYITSDLLRDIAFFIQSDFSQNRCCNKVYYKISKISILPKISCRFGCASDILYPAMYLYRECRYEHSLNFLHEAQERMPHPNILNYAEDVIYLRVKMRLDKILRNGVVKDILLINDYTYINELVIEQKISKKNGVPALVIPPLVMLHMLFILNYHKLGDTVTSQQSLQDLQTLMLLYDKGINIPLYSRDISWEILGICQQITGDVLGSLESYRSLLQKKSAHNIYEATMLRIDTLTRERV